MNKCPYCSGCIGYWQKLRPAISSIQKSVICPHCLSQVSNARSSMNRPGASTDNAHMESFFHSIKAERIHGETFKTKHELRMAIAGYIDQFYNPKRLHSGIGYLAPTEFERMVA